MAKVLAGRTQVPFLFSSLLNKLTSQVPAFAPKPPSVLATNLIVSYFEAGLVQDAQVLFDEMPQRDVIAWSAMISGYNSCNQPESAWMTFLSMMKDDARTQPNEFTFSGVLKACKSLNFLSLGASVHGMTTKFGVLGSIYVSNSLMDMYGSCCDSMDRAVAVFDEIVCKNTVSWTTLIANFTHLGDCHGGLRIFRRMVMENAEINTFNISITIRASASTGLEVYGKQIHAIALKHGLLSSIPVMNSILDMYARCTSLMEADRCFDKMVERDIISCNTMIARYEKSDPYKALCLFSRLESQGLTPDCFTFTSVIAAVASMAALGVGQQVHGGALRRGLDLDICLGNALIDMYAKCGSILNSCRVFNEMHAKNVVSWTSIIIGYGSHGHGLEAIDMFEQMVQSGVQPDRVVFVAILNACSHAGLVDQGLQYFKSMISAYNIGPDQEIYGCLVDLLGRAGRVKEAYKVIEAMPFMPDESVWGAFLGACKAHKRAELGKLAATRVLDLNPSISGTYMALSNIYADDGKWEDSARIRKLLRGIGNKKEPGQSWIEVSNQIISFIAADKLGPHIESVHETVNILRLHMKPPRDTCDDVRLSTYYLEGT